jgi:hypothetical protein
MELILKTNDEKSIVEILNLAKKLNVVVEKHGMEAEDREALKQRLLNFKAKGPSSFGDAAEWEREERKGKDLPFSE